MSSYTYTLDTISRVVDDILALRSTHAHNPFCIALTGTLGAGKTTLVRALCERLGVSEDDICSPTYAYMNEYAAHNQTTIYHFDIYRISGVEEFHALGFEEYVHPDAAGTPRIVIIEWPERIAEILNTIPHATIKLSYMGLDARRADIAWHEPHTT